MERPIILVGGGGHAKVIAYTLELCGHSVLGYTDPNNSSSLPDVAYLGGDEVISQYSPSEITLVNGLGGIGNAKSRTTLFGIFKNRGYVFLTVIHPSSVIAPDVQLEEGAQILAGVLIMPGCRIGMNTIVNTRASVDHDCDVGPHAHVAPGVTLSGGVRVEAEAHIGTGASIIQNLVVGRNATVGAGAVVVRSVPPGVTVVGVPARPIGTRI
jgi:UDP-perosamine 4-acetyltransferase